MKIKFVRPTGLLVALLALTAEASAQTTAFTYQGRLNDGASPANGIYDLRFTLHDALTSGAQQGALINISATPVTNGVFTVPLDFGSQFPGANRWLEIGVRTNGAVTFNTLAPRQPVTSTPYALTAGNVTGPVPASQLSGAVGSASLSGNYPAPVAFTNVGNAFAGNGSGLTAVNAATLNGQTGANFWNTNGNAAANPTNGAYLGTRDNLPLEARVNGIRALRLEPSPVSPNIVGGSPVNSVGPGLSAATISGGGDLLSPNRITASYATIVGGGSNVASGPYSIAGGNGARVSGASAVGLGRSPTAGGTGAVALGDQTTASGDASFAIGKSTLANKTASMSAGTQARALHDGTFVWADNRAVDFDSTSSNQFLIRAGGGVGINNNNPNGAALAVTGDVTVNGNISGNGTGITGLSLDSINSNGALRSSGGFTVNSSPGVGNGPVAIAAADVNGDGKIDLISANLSANTLTVATNDGSGRFEVSAAPGVGNSPRSVAAVDVNGDSRPDLISANLNSSSLTVLTNNGRGGFVLSSSPAVGAEPYSVTAADVNRDGKMDLISANRIPNALTVLTNNGSGGFALASSPAVGNEPLSVIAADVNGDGRPDLISANSADSTLTVLTNSASGSFVLASTVDVDLPFSVAAADINGDGRPDLITANAGSDTLTILTNRGAGTFEFASSPIGGTQPLSIATADVNGDGKLDVISANLSDNSVTIFINSGNGIFTVSASPRVGTQPFAVVAADVNGDTKPDLITANFVANSLSVLLNGPSFNGAFAGSFDGGFSGAFVGNGSGLSSLNAGNLQGTIPPSALGSVPAAILTGSVPDARLSANVALRAGGNSFTGNQTVNGTHTINGLGIVNGNSSVTGNQTVSSGQTVTGGQTINGDQIVNGNHAISGGQTITSNQTVSGSQSVSGNITTPGDIQWGNGSSLSSNTNGAIELGNSTINGGKPMLDFHYGIGSAQDYNVRIVNEANSQLAIYRNGSSTPMAQFNLGGLTVNGTLVSTSDRNAKENFAPVEPREVLEKVVAMPMSSWNYKADADTRHLGPMAQDFYAAFGMGPDDKHIATVDADGVALAAIQGLNQKLEETRAENAALKARLERLERLLNEGVRK